MILQAKNICFSYTKDKVVFDKINLQLSESEIVCIVGASGTGKSTLLKTLAGLLQISDGVILFEGDKVLGPEDKLVPGHEEIALVNQLFELDDYFTVEENLAIQMHHLTEEMRSNFVEELLAIFELSELRKVKSKHISGGEKQRLTMATALAKEPKCLLLDEPFVHLDVHLTKKIGNYIRKLAEVRKMGVILVTHNGVEALSWADQILMMKSGRIHARCTPDEAYWHPNTLTDGRYFGELNSVYIDGTQHLFRPIEFSFKAKKDYFKIELEWNYSLFKGFYYANYFKLTNNREIVLYDCKILKKVKEIYVQ